MNFNNIIKTRMFKIVFSVLIVVALILIFIFVNGTFSTSKLEKATVSVFCSNDISEWIYSDNASVGSGFFCEKGVVMTSYHNLLDSEGNLTEQCYVVTYNGSAYDADIFYCDPDFDVAVILVGQDVELYPALKISDRKPNVNEKVYSGCTPKTLHLKSSIVSGNVTKLNINGLANQYLMMTDLPLSPGCSGSPIVDKYNRVIGMNAFKSTEFGTEGLSFAIYGDKLQKAYEGYKNYVSNAGNNTATEIGIEFETSDRVSKGMITGNGITVKSISDTSVFKDSGLEPGCEILILDDSESICTAADFYEKWRPGRVVEYTLNGKWFEIVVE